MRNLFEEAGCQCRTIGVMIDQHGILKFCTCQDGAREQAQSTGGYSGVVGRNTGEVVRELQSKLREKNLCISKK